jgi:Ser/Thr protein kinase RdoA (MazF antagonist)
MSLRLSGGLDSLRQGWPSLELAHPLPGVMRAEVWVGYLDGGERRVVARRSLRSELSRIWEWTLLGHLATHGIGVPALVAATGGGFDVDGWHVYPYIDGHPPQEDDHRLQETIARVHAVTTGWPQRPGSASAWELLTETVGGDVDLAVMPTPLMEAIRGAWRAALVPARDAAVVHGDVGPHNALIDGRGQCVVLDWDQARVDAPWFDRADTETRRRAALAWEIATCWTVEPDYARARASELVD